MTEDDRTFFFQELFGLAATLTFEISEEAGEGYWVGMNDLTRDEVKRAFGAALRTCKFMPKPAELRELAGKGTPRSGGIRAWSIFRNAIAFHGAYASVDFADKRINATARLLGGWVYLCGLPQDELNRWKCKEFIEAYQSMPSGQPAEQIAPLAGTHEIAAVGRGAPLPPIALIDPGSTPKALPARKPPETEPEITQEESDRNKKKARDLFDSTLGKIDAI